MNYYKQCSAGSCQGKISKKKLVIIIFYNVGYCKHKEKCRFEHGLEDCDNKCDYKQCIKRHRQVFKNGNNCKFKLRCEFKHTLNPTNKPNFLIDYLKKTV